MIRPRAATMIATLLLSVAAGCGGGSAPDDEPTPVGDARDANRWSVRFTDVAREAGVAIAQESGSSSVDYIIDSVGSGAAWLDYDGDGDPDLYLAQGATREHPDAGPPDRLLRHDGIVGGVPRFTDVTSEAGLGDRSWSFAVSVADYDGDGDPDIYLTNWGPNRLYRNNGDGSFSEIAAAAGIDDPSWSAGAAWGDVDLDGDLDLYVANYVEFDFDRYPARGERRAGGGPPCVWKGFEVYCGPRNLIAAPDRFYRNDGVIDDVPRFSEATAEFGLDPGSAWFALDARFVDTDDDGDLDLYVANDSVQNAYFVNDGGRFEESAIFAGLAYNEQGDEQAGMGIAVGDTDGDGRLDIAVTNFSHDHDTLYHNEGGQLFTDVSYAAGLGSESFFALAWGVALIDFDLDGREDLYVARGHVYPQVDSRDVGTAFRQPNALFRNLGSRFVPASSTSESVADSSRSVVPADVDGDGDIDLLVTNLDGPPNLLRNDGDGGSWLTVRLHGNGANRDGIGARVSVTAAGRTQQREITRSASYAASTLPLAHFGLDGVTRVDRVEVRWPDGRRTVRENVAAGSLLRIEAPPD